MSERLIGTLDAFAETGTEGIYWAFLDNAHTGYDSLNILADGDYLFVENGNGGIEWEGQIKLVYDTNLEPYPFNDRGDNWQRVLGCTVHGLQKNVDPLIWFDWFASSRPAVLIKRSI